MAAVGNAETTTVLWVRGSSDPLPPEAARETAPRSGDRIEHLRHWPRAMG